MLDTVFDYGKIKVRNTDAMACDVRNSVNLRLPCCREPDARLPGSKEEIVEQAYRASLAAWKDGIKRQKLEILLPLIGATELDDWYGLSEKQSSAVINSPEQNIDERRPGGIRQEFKAAQPMMEDLLRRLKQEDELQGSLSADIWVRR